MNGTGKKLPDPPFDMVFLVAALLWTFLVLTLAGWNHREARVAALETARASAEESFNKDLAYRRWATMHGGVYVPVTPATSPNPYLARVPGRDIVTPSGQRLTLVNPAYMTRQVHELAGKAYGPRGHITSLNPIRPENAPDEWERKALQDFERGRVESFSLEPVGGKTYFRLMRPLIVETDCLKCHAQQGYREGDIRGGISASLPWKPFGDALTRQLYATFPAYGAIWAAGILALYTGKKRLQHHLAARRRAETALQQANEELERRVEERTAELNRVNTALQREIPERRLAEQGLCASLRDKELLLDEIHHRVKNNLQVVSALLALQAKGSRNPELTEGFHQNQNRIRAMALVHEKLYRSKNFSRIDLAGYVKSLAEQLFQSYDAGQRNIALQIQTDGVAHVDIGKAVPCGLVMNELISNALRHAFRGDGSGELRITIRETPDGEIEITVGDSGPGLPDDIDIHNPGSVGLHLVNGLVTHQLNGRLEVKRNNGTEFRIRFHP